MASLLVLVGVGIGAAARSLTTLLIVISPLYQASKALLWLTGSVVAVGTLDLPAGIFTAAIGAPFFIFLLYRSRHSL
jgi:iron complex transport system permease protein